MGGYAISRQNNLALHLDCLTCWLSYFTLVCLWCGRTGLRSRDYQIFSDRWITTFSYAKNTRFFGWVDYHILSAKNTRIHFKVTFSLSSISSASFCGRQKGARSLFLVSGTLLTVQNRIEKMSVINSKNKNKKGVTSKTD